MMSCGVGASGNILITLTNRAPKMPDDEPEASGMGVAIA